MLVRREPSATLSLVQHPASTAPIRRLPIACLSVRTAASCSTLDAEREQGHRACVVGAPRAPPLSSRPSSVPVCPSHKPAHADPCLDAHTGFVRLPLCGLHPWHPRSQAPRGQAKSKRPNPPRLFPGRPSSLPRPPLNLDPALRLEDESKGPQRCRHTLRGPSAHDARGSRGGPLQSSPSREARSPVHPTSRSRSRSWRWSASRTQS